MIIISLTLIGYKRLKLNNIETITINPKEVVQLILGTNGSGKSSLIKELTPLPAELANFSKEGSKSITIIHNGNNYILGSTFTHGAKHTFLKNGEELNDGKTSSVQKELVRQEFGITPAIHELLIGTESFHSMSPSKRREWFTTLSDINYDYALEVYSKLKERSRDTSGALKLAKKRLVIECSKVINSTEENKLIYAVEQAHIELNLLIAQSSPLVKSVQEYKNDQVNNFEELTKLSNKLLNMRFIAPYGIHPQQKQIRNEWGEITKPGFSSLKDIDNLLVAIMYDIVAKETLINSAVKEHTKLTTNIGILVKTGEEGVKSLHVKLTQAQTDKREVLAKRKLLIEGISVVNAISALESVYENLVHIFSHIPENENKKFSRAQFKETEESLLKNKDNRTTMLSNVAKLNNKKLHMEAHRTNSNTVCPKCSHSWVIGYNDKEYAVLMEDISSRENELAINQKTISDLEEEIVAINDYFNLYRDYLSCIKNWPILKPFWDYLTNGDLVINSPRKALSVTNIFRIDLELELTAKHFDDKINEVLDLIESTEELGDANINEMQFKLNEYSIQIESMTFELIELQGHVKEYRQYKKQLNESIELGKEITLLMAVSERTSTDTIEMIRRETLNHCVRQLQHALALKQETLSAAILQKGIIADLENQVIKLSVEDESAKALVKQLSPTDGLIAEGLLGFISNFTGQMNTLISKVWTYPLKIMNCALENNELTYKFPLMVQAKDNIAPDVKDGSTGMREIINLAFKIVAMRYLGLAESPLYLDEFAGAMDVSHRSAATDMIKSIMEQQSFTQLFMISHYADGYGAFTNAEVCVLDERNIVVPTVYNKHVKIN